MTSTLIIMTIEKLKNLDMNAIKRFFKWLNPATYLWGEENVMTRKEILDHPQKSLIWKQNKRRQ